MRSNVPNAPEWGGGRTNARIISRRADPLAYRTLGDDALSEKRTSSSEFPANCQELIRDLAISRNVGRPVCLLAYDSPKRLTLIGTSAVVSIHSGAIHECGLEQIAGVVHPLIGFRRRHRRMKKVDDFKRNLGAPPASRTAKTFVTDLWVPARFRGTTRSWSTLLMLGRMCAGMGKSVHRSTIFTTTERKSVAPRSIVGIINDVARLHCSPPSEMAMNPTRLLSAILALLVLPAAVFSQAPTDEPFRFFESKIRPAPRREVLPLPRRPEAEGTSPRRLAHVAPDRRRSRARARRRRSGEEPARQGDPPRRSRSEDAADRQARAGADRRRRPLDQDGGPVARRHEDARAEGRREVGRQGDHGEGPRALGVPTDSKARGPDGEERGLGRESDRRVPLGEARSEGTRSQFPGRPRASAPANHLRPHRPAADAEGDRGLPRGQVARFLFPARRAAADVAASYAARSGSPALARPCRLVTPRRTATNATTRSPTSGGIAIT